MVVIFTFAVHRIRYFYLSPRAQRNFLPPPKIKTKKGIRPFFQSLQYSGSCYSCFTPTYYHFPMYLQTVCNGFSSRRTGDGKETGEGEGKSPILLKVNQTLPCPHPLPPLQIPNLLHSLLALWNPLFCTPRKRLGLNCRRINFLVFFSPQCP